jgi:aminodeoxyfutalosine deaminase
LHWASAQAKERGWPLCTHVAESEEEFLMFRERSGHLFHWLSKQRDMSDCGLRTPVQHLEACHYLQANLLAAHVNYLGAGDAELLGRRRVSVVHCPRSHAYFRHREFPLTELTRAGVNICLGTDSLASMFCPPRHLSPELSLFPEMQMFAKKFPGVRPQDILKMATINGAKALRRPELGRLAPGAMADLIAIPYTGDRRKAAEAVVQHTGKVSSSMIAGKWVLEA